MLVQVPLFIPLVLVLTISSRCGANQFQFQQRQPYHQHHQQYQHQLNLRRSSDYIGNSEQDQQQQRTGGSGSSSSGDGDGGGGGPPVINVGGGSTLPPTTTDNGDWPWRHHVDFNEQHPGEDQVAVESNSRGSAPVQYQRQTTLYSPTRISHHHHQQQQQGSRNSPQFNPYNPFNVFHNFNIQPVVGTGGVHSLWNLYSPRSWWSGPNVCIKREEEDEKEDGRSQQQSQQSQRGNNLIGVATGNNSTTLSGHPALQMSLTNCEDLDTRRVCTSRLIGQGVRKVVKTVYECCDGYQKDERMQECERGRFENIAKTMEALGARQFLQLVESTNLLRKVETEVLTIFVPTDEAVNSYRSSSSSSTSQSDGNQMSNSVAPSARNSELIRRRRSVLLHGHLNNQREESGRGRGQRADGDNSQRSQQHSLADSSSHHDQRQHQHQNEQDVDTRQPDAIIEMNFVDDVDWRRNALDEQDHFIQGHPGYAPPPPTSDNNSSSNNNNNNNNNNNELAGALLSHMIQGQIRTDDFVDERVIYSESSEGGDRSVIRMNTWDVEGEKVNTVNCARMISVNHRCTNGNIHLVNRMMEPVTKSIADIVSADPNFSVFKSLLEVSGLMEKFRDSSQHLTLLVPTDRAINEELDQGLMLKMRRGDPCLNRIIQNHIIPISFCSSVILRKGQVRNLNHGLLTVERTGDDDLYLNGTKIVKRDWVATNGVIQVLDGVLVAENDRPLTSALADNDLTSFLELLRRYQLTSELDELSNITVFAPSNEAFDTLPQEVKDHPQRMREVLLYHIATPETRACHFSHQQKISTKLTGNSIQMNLYSNFPLGTEAEVTAQCGRLTKLNRPACSGVIHVIDRVLIPADMDMIDMLGTQTDFSIIIRLVEQSGLTDTLRGTGPFTMFAPKDSAFYALPRPELEKILRDREEAIKIVKSHIISENLCCAGILPNMWFLTKRVTTLSGGQVHISRDSSGVMYGGSKVTTCDLTAKNGVIHSIDTIFKAEEARIFTSNTLMGSCLPQKLETTQIMAFFVRG